MINSSNPFFLYFIFIYRLHNVLLQPSGMKEEGLRWVHFAGDQVLRLASKCGGGGDGGSEEGGFRQNLPG